jgi:hypothetical protein
MNLSLLPTFHYTEASAPPLSPLAEFEQSEGSVRLGLAGSGSIEVTRTGINVLAPDLLAYQKTIDRLGQWAQGQWLTAQGFRVLQGAAVARNGKAIVLIGGPRCGASLLALVLSRRGWGLISDGLVVIDKNGIVRALDPVVTMDAEATLGLPPEVSITRSTTGRARVKVTTTGHSDAELSVYVFMRVQHSLNSLAFAQITFTSEARRTIERNQIPSFLVPRNPAFAIVEAPVWRIARPVSSPDPFAYSPPVLASLLTTALDAEMD